MPGVLKGRFAVGEGLADRSEETFFKITGPE